MPRGWRSGDDRPRLLVTPNLARGWGTWQRETGRMNTGIQGRRSPELAASRDLDSGGSRDGANRALDRDARKTPERAILARSRLGLSMLLAHGKPAWLCGIRRLPSSTVLGRLQHLAALQAGGRRLGPRRPTRRAPFMPQTCPERPMQPRGPRSPGRPREQCSSSVTHLHPKERRTVGAPFQGGSTGSNPVGGISGQSLPGFRMVEPSGSCDSCPVCDVVMVR